MNYYYDYSFLEEKILDHYKTNTLVQGIDAFAHDLHSNTYRIRDIILNKVTCFTGNEITASIDILGIKKDEVMKCFFKVEKSFENKKELLDYIKKRKQE